MSRTLVATLLGVVIAAAAAIVAAPASAKDDKGKQWAEGIPFTTDYEAAIKEARETGKMLLVYNGWEREKI